MRRLFIISALGVLFLGALTGCAKLNSAQTGTMSVRMTDAPGDFQAVNISLIQIAASYEAEGDSKPEGGWTVLWQGSRMCDLLQLRNGVFTSLGEGRLPAGQYNRLRMLLGNGSNVVVSGVQHPLAVPSEGIKLKGRFDVPANGNVDIALDFDVARSIVLEGGQYKLKPTIRVFTTEPQAPQPGAIAGVVIAKGALTWVFAIQGADTITSTTAGEDGHFQLSLLAAGNYSVAFAPVSGYLGKTLPEVVVTAGNTANAGSIELEAVGPPPPPPGAINGQILSGSSPATLFVLQGADTVRRVNVVDQYFTVDGLEAGSYSLLARAEGFEDASRPDVVVNPGETTYVGTIELVELPPPPPPGPGAVAGRVVPPGMPTTVTVLQGGLVVTSSAVDVDGTFLFTDLPAGSYTLYFHPEFDYSDTTIEVEVRPDATTDVGDVPMVS